MCSKACEICRWTLNFGSFSEVRDLELRLRLHDLTLARLERLEAGVRVEDVAEDDTVELHRRAGLERGFLRP